jgi:glycine cleavage system transcriptional repressor
MLIISAVGADRPGMAYAVAQILFDCGCNIEDTTMTRLSGQFAMILAVESSDLAAQELETRLSPLRHALGLHIDVSSAGDAPPGQTAQPRFILTAYGAEKTGLLARLTAVLADKQVNVTDVQTRVASARMVYVMILELELPADLEAEALEDELRTHLSDLQVSLRPLEEDTL